MHRAGLLILISILITVAVSLPASAARESKVMLIPVTGEIQLGLSPFVERMTEEANDEDYDLIIYEINTFGGRLDAAVIIRDAIKGNL